MSAYSVHSTTRSSSAHPLRRFFRSLQRLLLFAFLVVFAYFCAVNSSQILELFGHLSQLLEELLVLIQNR